MSLYIFSGLLSLLILIIRYKIRIKYFIINNIEEQLYKIIIIDIKNNFRLTLILNNTSPLCSPIVVDPDIIQMENLYN